MLDRWFRVSYIGCFGIIDTNLFLKFLRAVCLSLPSQPTKQRWRELFATHNTFQAAQRIIYHNYREEAMDRPEKYGCWAIDGIDQSKTEVPHFPQLRNAKYVGKDAPLLTQHLVGVLPWGVGYSKQPHVYAVFKDVPHDPNMVCSVIWAQLVERLECGHKLPSNLRLQLDNCSRENKNHTVLAFCSFLTAVGFFESVELNFMMVGHTHNDVDQFFSQISR